LQVVFINLSFDLMF